MDLEWAKDGRTGELFIVQARPETVRSRDDAGVLERWKLDREGEVLLRGQSVGARIGAGPVRVVRSVEELGSFREGDVLVAEMTDPDWVPVMKRAAAIITDGGGRTCHAAIVSRELGVPCIVGTQNATTTLAAGTPVTVDGSGGAEGRMLAGLLPYTRERIDAASLLRPRTRVMINLADPGRAFSLADGPRVWVMCEIPANVIAIESFAQLFDERDEAVTRTFTAAIRGAHAAGRPIGICGQAPSDFPELARFLVRAGIDSVSLDPASVLRILPVLVDAERAPEPA